MIYPISNSFWVSLVHIVPKKGGMIVFKNENNELIPTRIVIGCVLIIESLIKLLKRIIFLSLSWTRCWNGWLGKLSTISWMVIQDIIK